MFTKNTSFGKKGAYWEEFFGEKKVYWSTFLWEKSLLQHFFVRKNFMGALSCEKKIIGALFGMKKVSWSTFYLYKNIYFKTFLLWKNPIYWTFLLKKWISGLFFGSKKAKKILAWPLLTGDLKYYICSFV